MSHDDPLDRLNRLSQRSHRSAPTMHYLIDDREGHETYCMALPGEVAQVKRANPHLKEVDHRDYWRFARRIGGLNP